MMKIAFYSMSMQKGGSERVLANLSNYLVKCNHEVIIITNLNSEICYELDSRIRLYALDKLNYSKMKYLRYIKKVGVIREVKLQRILKREKPDVVVSFLPEPSIRLLRIRKPNYKRIISVRNDPNVEYKNQIIRKMMLKNYPKADGVIFQTSDARHYFDDIIKCICIVIPNPVNEKFIVPSYDGERESIFVAVGRLEEQKNYQLLIKAMRGVVKKYPLYQLYIYGEGNLKNKLNQYIKVLNLEKNVFLKGQTDNIKNEIYQKYAFVLSSDYEGMPNCLMEAMCLGLPVIATDCPIGGPKFLIKNNINGLLVPIKNEKKITQAMIKLIENKVLCKKLGHQASIIQKDVNLAVICQKYENYIKSVVDGYD